MSGAAAASGLQVSPVSLSLQPSQSADGLWLSNVSDSPLFAQVRVYHWAQQGGEQQLIPSGGLVISPPLLQIPPSSRQLVRVIRVGPPPAGPGAVEDAYRLSIDELPVSTNGLKRGLHFVFHYSVPIFVEPTGTGAGQPQLRWAIVRSGSAAMLQVSNGGAAHAQLAAVRFVSNGHTADVTSGLLGYVLPGATMRFALGQSARSLTSHVTLEAMVNGSLVTQDVSLADNRQ